jgi:predicted methyltransferase
VIDNGAMNRTPTRRAALSAFAGFAGLPVLGALPACSALPDSAATPADDEALRAALAGAHRSAANRARDGARHPYETLRFFGIRPTQRVVELTPGGGWYTEILAPYLRPQGLFCTAHFAKDTGSEGRRRARANYDARLAKQPELYDRLFSGTLPSGGRFGDITAALEKDGGADLIVTFRNVHNWLEDGSLDDTLKACFSLLKRGGVLGVVDHRAAPGTPIETQMKTGYVTEALMEARAQQAGFRLAARSEVNANPRDTKDHVGGVWSLPPTYAGKDVDRERFAAIGESDRFTHRYVKG